jgi:hypothetical protein
MFEGMDFRISDYQILFYPEEPENQVKINSVKKALSELTQKYKGAPEYPSSYGFGQDFPVGVK